MPGFYSKRIGIKPQTNRYGLCAPESVDDSQDGEAGGDEDEALVLRGRPLRRDVLVLAPEDKSCLIYTVRRPLIGHVLSMNLGFVMGFWFVPLAGFGLH